MFKKIKEFFTGKPAVVETPVVSAPYKVPEPAATTPVPNLVVVQVEQKPAPAAKKAKAPAKPKAEKTATPKARKPRAKKSPS
jgi:hypothetical protein